jgi:hypothetical protein
MQQEMTQLLDCSQRKMPKHLQSGDAAQKDDSTGKIFYLGQTQKKALSSLVPGN